MGPEENGSELSTPASACDGSLALAVCAVAAVSAPPWAEELEPEAGEGATWAGVPVLTGG
jgi:hypothetical protein